jgi:lysozyme
MTERYRLLASQMLKEDEGVRQFVYKDHLGFWTIGCGRNVDQRNGRGLSKDEIEYLLQNDISANITMARTEIPSFDELSDTRKAVLISMIHQIGSLKGWPKFRASIASKDWVGAKANMLDSKWAKVDTPARAKRLADLFFKG